MSGPFDFVNQINFGKNDIIESGEKTEEEYLPFIINRQFSLFPDTIFIANEANYRLKESPKHSQFLFYLNLADKKKRFTKWNKVQEDERITFLSERMNISRTKAAEMIDLIPEEVFNEIFKKYNNTGGRG